MHNEESNGVGEGVGVSAAPDAANDPAFAPVREAFAAIGIDASIRELRPLDDALPVLRSDVEAVGNFDPRLVSSIRVEEGPAHDRVRVWNRGGLAGDLYVTHGDGEALSLALTEILSGRMCAGRGAATRALREAEDDFTKAQERLAAIADDLDAAAKDAGINPPAVIARASATVLRDLIVSLGDASCACSVAAKRVEREIGGAR